MLHRSYLTIAIHIAEEDTMPPSGFSKKAIDGLLDFVKIMYEQTLDKYTDQKGYTETEMLQNVIQRMTDNSDTVVIRGDGVAGLNTFVSCCFADLINEIQAGQDKYGRDVVEGKAMQKEITQISEYQKKTMKKHFDTLHQQLSKFTI